MRALCPMQKGDLAIDEWLQVETIVIHVVRSNRCHAATRALCSKQPRASAAEAHFTRKGRGDT